MAIRWGAGLHWSQSSRAWLGFFAPLPSGRVLLRHELTWIRTSPEDAAREILQFCRAQAIVPPSIIANVECFPKNWKETGPTIAQTFARGGVFLRPGSTDRINGWSRVRSWLKLRVWADEVYGPALIIHPDCRRFLRTLPTLVSDRRNADDVADTSDTHPANGLRYYVMSEPAPWQAETARKPGLGTWGYELRHLRQRQRRHVLGADLVRAR